MLAHGLGVDRAAAVCSRLLAPLSNHINQFFGIQSISRRGKPLCPCAVCVVP